jgi:hypothetical protein
MRSMCLSVFASAHLCHASLLAPLCFVAPPLHSSAAPCVTQKRTCPCAVWGLPISNSCFLTRSVFSAFSLVLLALIALLLLRLFFLP